MKPSILIIDDNKDILTALRILLNRDFDVVTESDPNNIPVLLRKKSFNLVFLDMNFTQGAIKGEEGFKWLDVILDIDPEAVVILITAYGDIEIAVKGIKEGASDFILKPWNNEKLLTTISLALELKKEKSKNTLYEAQNKIISSGFPEIIGQSDVMIDLFETIEMVAKTEANVLITGENGTGKELVARAIHNKSLNSDGVFLGVDMGSIPDKLFESEMFGHTKGAFTGADKNRIGRIEAATGGSLFLDEIGNIPLTMQPKLLRVLENREVVPLGSSKKREINTRLICATNSNINKLVDNDLFRNDLLYRINTVELKVPALRERKSDIPLLLKFYLDKYSKKYGKKGLKISENCLRKLTNYCWPGNVRELNNFVEKSVILNRGNIIDIDPPQDSINTKKFSSFNLEDIEKSAISEVINNEHGNLTKAAETLGITRSTLYRKIEKYDL